ncbi:30S ribosomal protein S2 [Puniceicoccus vermicola]|uniref:Small ribosomal subunit protein uS2 n=1 Tax=Puniceicoccus vermicola TaxID=388746 RepID=A0A7X1AY49_9BACT|nr:30S ribosomal protein S2 [Puniceicoccus vermicola]MBC2601929.1 30S ribosomal protein S2 [Puniceicoccus vermicola]
MNITPKDLLDAGVHFGHQVRRWNPNFKPYLFDHRNGISIIDLEKTYNQLEKACQFVTDTVRTGKNILFVGTKRQAQEIVREAAAETRMPFTVNRWMGGTLTNFATIKTSLQKYRRFLAMEKDGSLNDLPKKEGAAIRRQMVRMNRNFEGIIDINEVPSALFIIDVNNEEIAVEEARRLGIPVIALVDTNSNPSFVDYPIPGNDDAAKSIRIIVEAIVEAIQDGLESRESVSMPKSSGPVISRNVFSDVENEGEVTLPEGFSSEEGSKESKES